MPSGAQMQNDNEKVQRSALDESRTHVVILLHGKATRRTRESLSALTDSEIAKLRQKPA
jgi:hypothetical protein